MYMYWTHSLSYRTDWWMLTKLGRDEVIMALHMRLGFWARSSQRWTQGGATISQWGAPFQREFFFRSQQQQPNASLYPELKYRDCLLFGLISQISQSCFMINHLLRNLLTEVLIGLRWAISAPWGFCSCHFCTEFFYFTLK